MDFSLRDFSRDSFWTGHAQQSIFFPNMRSPWLLWRNFYPWSKHYACKKEKLVMSSSRFAFLVSSFFEAPPNLPFPKKKAPKRRLAPPLGSQPHPNHHFPAACAPSLLRWTCHREASRHGSKIGAKVARIQKHSGHFRIEHLPVDWMCFQQRLKGL